MRDEREMTETNSGNTPKYDPTPGLCKHMVDPSILVRSLFSSEAANFFHFSDSNELIGFEH